MTKTKSLSLIVLALGSFVVLTGFHGTCCGSKTPEARAERMSKYATAKVEDVLDDLDATGEQQTRVLALTERVLKNAMPLVTEHQQAKVELRAEWESKSPDPAKVHAIVDARIDSVRKVVHEVADAIIEVHHILSPEQRAEISSWFHE